MNLPGGRLERNLPTRKDEHRGVTLLGSNRTDHPPLQTRMGPPVAQEVRDGAGTSAALEAGRRAGIGALVILGSPEFSLPATARYIAGFAARHRLAAISPFRVFSTEGGLMSYGPTREHFEPRGGVLIGKILQGAKAGDLPIELPSKFELIINLKTTRALGLLILQSLLLRADEVIE